MVKTALYVRMCVVIVKQCYHTTGHVGIRGVEVNYVRSDVQ
jgi:hypothetical protein